MAKDLKKRDPREYPGAFIAPVFVEGMLSGLVGKESALQNSSSRPGHTLTAT